jgi:hypothetical protein
MKPLALFSAVLALAALASGAHACPITGASSGSSSINGYSTSTWVLTCRGGERTTFEVRGDGGTDLDLLVLDNDGKLIVQTSGPGDHCRVSWHSVNTERVFILLINRGTRTNYYSYSAR